ncbi:hypothetical protein DMENIID0001_068980 [Sergentomyia squamirostris]
MMEHLIVVFITATAMCSSISSAQHYHFAEPRADPPNVKGHYSYSDPHGAIFHVTYETDKKTSSPAKSPTDGEFSDFGSSYGGAKRKTQFANFNRPMYIVNTDNDDDDFDDKANYQISSTTTKAPYKYGQYQYQYSTTPSPAYNSLSGSVQQKPGIVNNGNTNQGSFRPVTTKFQVNHPSPSFQNSNPVPVKNPGNLISSRYQQYTVDDDEEYVETKQGKPSITPVSDKYLTDYQQALTKLQAASTNVARRPNKPKTPIKYNGIPPNVPNNYSPVKGKPQHFGEPDSKVYKPKFKLQNVPNLYPKDEAPFKPSVGYPGGAKGAPTKQKEFFELPPEYAYTNDNVQYYNVDGGAIPPQSPSKSQQPNPQYLKRQHQIKLQQQLVMEKIKKARVPHTPTYSQQQPSQTNFRPIAPPQPPHRFNIARRKPSRAFTPAAGRSSFKSRPLVDGPYSIRISM